METSEREPSLAEALDDIIKELNKEIADLTEKIEAEDAKISEINEGLSKLWQSAKKADSELLEELLVIKRDIAAVLSHKNDAKKFLNRNISMDCFLEFCAWLFLGFGIFYFCWIFLGEKSIFPGLLIGSAAIVKGVARYLNRE